MGVFCRPDQCIMDWEKNSAEQDQVGFLNLDSLARCLNTLEADHGKVEVDRLVECLSHSSQCPDSRCTLTSCYSMKIVLLHTRECTSQEGCQVCAHLVALCCYHARVCTDLVCAIEYCANIKRKLSEMEALFQN